MNKNRRTVLHGITAGAAMLALPQAARAAFPEKPIKLVIGYSTGGSTDATARLLGRQLEQRKAPVFVEPVEPACFSVQGNRR
mgnify:CR=1 FL=1